MKHPEPGEWIPFIFGEADVQSRKRLAEHLDSCPECARELAGWRRSLRKLDRWKAPKAPKIVPWTPVLKWAVAAALAVALGLLIGRSTAGPGVSVAALHDEVEASLRRTLEAELRQEFAELNARHANNLAAAEVRLSQASALENQRLWRSWIETLNSLRAQDSQAIEILLQQAQERNDAAFVALRKDLETLASMTDEAIRQARLQLVLLADTQIPID